MRTLVWLLPALSVATACASPCAQAPLTPVESPRFAVELKGLQSYSLALYDIEGDLLHENWVDSNVVLRGSAPSSQTLTFESPGAALAMATESDELITLSAEGSLGATVDVASERGGSTYDYLALSPSVALIAWRGGTEEIFADEIVSIDLELNRVVRRWPLANLVTGNVRVGRLARLTEDRVAFGLDAPTGEGSIGILDLATELVQVGAIAGFRRCVQVWPITNETTVAAPRLGLWCNDPSRPSFVLVEFAAGGIVPNVVGAIATGSLGAYFPIEPFIATGSPWVVARGEPRAGAQALVAVNVESGATQELYAETIDPQWGEPLGWGSFDPTQTGAEGTWTGVLIWPSVASGAVRFAQRDGSFEQLASLNLPQCVLNAVPRRALSIRAAE